MKSTLFRFRTKRLAAIVAAVIPLLTGLATLRAEDIDSLQTQFRHQTGVRLAFDRENLPEGTYFDVLVPLPESKRIQAARLVLLEAEKYPRGYLGRTGLSVVGIFAACLSKQGDGFRPYDATLKGYRYFGVYNRSDAIVAAYYSDQQLRLTFHHETFHHLDATENGITELWQLSSDDARFRAAVSGRRPYPPIKIRSEDLAELKTISSGRRLRDAVSGYASKNAREDQAETARYLMTQLPESLIQMSERPDLAGSQRLLHILGEYRKATASDLRAGDASDAASSAERTRVTGQQLANNPVPDVQWYVDVALGRTPPSASRRLLAEMEQHLIDLQDTERLELHLRNRIRNTLAQVAELPQKAIPATLHRKLVRNACKLTESLIHRRIVCGSGLDSFTVWGGEDSEGINWTLRTDLKQFCRDASNLTSIAGSHPQHRKTVETTLRTNHNLIDRYEQFILRRWTLSKGTRQSFETLKTKLNGH